MLLAPWYTSQCSSSYLCLRYYNMSSVLLPIATMPSRRAFPSSLALLILCILCGSSLKNCCSPSSNVCRLGLVVLLGIVWEGGFTTTSTRCMLSLVMRGSTWVQGKICCSLQTPMLQMIFSPDGTISSNHFVSTVSFLSVRRARYHSSQRDGWWLRAQLQRCSSCLVQMLIQYVCCLLSARPRWKDCNSSRARSGNDTERSPPLLSTSVIAALSGTSLYAKPKVCSNGGLINTQMASTAQIRIPEYCQCMSWPALDWARPIHTKVPWNPPTQTQPWWTIEMRSLWFWIKRCLRSVCLTDCWHCHWFRRSGPKWLKPWTTSKVIWPPCLKRSDAWYLFNKWDLETLWTLWSVDQRKHA